MGLLRALVRRAATALQAGPPSSLPPLAPRRPMAIYTPPLTSDTHPGLTRSPAYAELSEIHIQAMQGLLGRDGVVQDAEILNIHNVDWSRRYRGASRLLLKPSTVTQVSHVLKYCNTHRLAVVPQGGNTGLVGGSVPVFDEIILSLHGLNKILHFDPIGSVLVCEAGCILQVLEEHLLNEHGHCMPVDLGAKGSCHIGGNVATNAGGLRLLKYGSLHGSVLGLEVVLADGTILSNLCTLRKDNTGFDLKQLFIGSEGSLGVITKVAISTPKAPKSTSLVLLSVSDFTKVQKILSRAKSSLSDVLSAFEFWDKQSSDIVFKHHANLKSDFGHLKGFFSLLIETANFEDSTQDRVTAFVGELMEQGLCSDGVIASSKAQIQSVWCFRECIPEVCAREGIIYKYDVSLPTPVLYTLVEEMRQRLASFPAVSVVGYGHAGDGNLHLNIMTSEASKDVEALMEPFIYDFIKAHHGSVSAEHGLGLMKAEKVRYSKSAEMIIHMKKIKHLFDPNAILNPYKVLPKDP